MSQHLETAPITVPAAADVIDKIDALAAATNRSRADMVTEALPQYLDTSTWQIQRIEEGLAATRMGRVRPAENVFADIAAKHGWDR